MKIYFCGSIRAGRRDADLYLKIVELLRPHGTVLTEHVATGADIQHENAEGLSEETATLNTDMAWLHDSDVIVAEVTQPSLGVGFELGVGWKLAKPTLVLFRPNDTSANGLSALVRGPEDGRLWKCFDYSSVEQLVPVINDFMLSVKKGIEI